MYAIVGAGFGLYGYLPALIEGFGETVVLPRAYEEKVLARGELAGLLRRIRWADDEAAALAVADAVVIATPPRRQYDVVAGCLESSTIERLVLEKPLATTPALASDLIDRLARSGKRYRIGYSFLHASWYPGLDWPTRADSTTPITIHWTFMAHHFANGSATWKRIHAEGGGALRFYGIHLLALLAEKGYDAVPASAMEGAAVDEPERWRATFTGPGLPDCEVLVDSRCTTRRFDIVRRSAANVATMLALGDPFEQEVAAASRGGDARVGVLERLLGTFDQDDRRFATFYRRVNTLWRKAEGEAD